MARPPLCFRRGSAAAPGATVPFVQQRDGSVGSGAVCSRTVASASSTATMGYLAPSSSFMVGSALSQQCLRVRVRVGVVFVFIPILQ